MDRFCEDIRVRKGGWGKNLYIASFDPGSVKMGVLIEKRDIEGKGKVEIIHLECADLKSQGDGCWEKGMVTYLDKLDKKINFRQLGLILIEKQNPINMGFRKKVSNSTNIGIQYSITAYFINYFKNADAPASGGDEKNTQGTIISVIQPQLKGLILDYPKKCDRITRKKSALVKCLSLLKEYGETKYLQLMSVTRGQSKFYDMADVIVQTESYWRLLNA